MDIVSSVTYSEVMETYLRDHPVERAHEANTNRDGAENLERAEKSLGCWWHVRLSRADVLGITLPWHLSEGGRLELVPRTGLTVAEAAARVRDGGARWTEANPCCAAKLELLRQAPLTAVYLSTSPVPHDHYADLRVRNGLIHLDGLHRTLAWELSHRLPEEARLDAYLAGTPQTRPTGTTPPVAHGEERA
ncbi:DUF6309 family protein [Kitasatospora sp. NBC_01266]|uniref:DUF6309 family protein n=1 Tax=Kitasatospora sp. NBC_01266 TaxID=2903572 RepID=UPI002E340DE5|nr:DUF6309 family protein [Kitasatospora sp. NBC_01266]